MYFIDKPGNLVVFFLVLFGLFYAAYLVRMIWLGRSTRSRLNPVFYKLCLRAAYFVLLLISMLGPYFGVSKREVPIREKELFIALDLSRSMKSDDIQPSRFEKARSEIWKIVEGLEQTKVGLIIFTSIAYLQVPLTSDKNALKTYIDILNPDLIEDKGTMLEAPLKLAIQKYQEEGATQAVLPKSRIVLLISDGQDFSPNLKHVLAAAEHENVKLYTLGIGTETGSTLYSKGKEVTVSLENKVLKKIAAQSNGAYYEISDQRKETYMFVKQINDLREEQVVEKKSFAIANKYFYFLLPALLLMLLDVFITLNVLKV